MRGGLTYLESPLTSRDGTTLFTRLIRPPQPLAVMGIVHGYGDHSGCYQETMETLAGAGLEAQAFDLRGHGKSAGRRGFVRHWPDYLEDLSAFLERLKRAAGGGLEAGGRPLFLLAQSHGALLLIHAALRGLEGISGMVFTAPYLRFALPAPPWKLMVGRLAERIAPGLPIPSEVTEELLTGDPAIQSAARNDPLALRITTPGWFFAAQRAQVEALARAPQFRLPVLILQGDQDRITDPAASRLFYERAGSEDKQFHSLPAMRHEPLREVGRQQVWDRIIAWVHERMGE
jgi:alpha-beta hydrolase superfamily lysophospholipase